MDVAALDPVEDFASFGIRAFTTTRAAGTLGTNGSEPSAFVGRTSFAFTTASEFGSIRDLRRRRFSMKSFGSIGAYRTAILKDLLPENGNA